ncbi:MAG: hypothetical protein LBU68_02515 [Rickettsiales bacterium]|jgi:hypothetical protein|nr:hypothetical protein [Rickettsiales bacterium]
MFVYENFEFENTSKKLQNILLQTDFFVPDTIYDEQKMLKICEIASRLHIKTMTVHYTFVEHIWKWVEKKNIKICAFIDCDLFFENGIFNFARMFSAVKNSFQNGANFIDIKLPKNADIYEILKIATNAVDGKNSAIKITVQPEGYSKSIQIKDFMKKMQALKFFNFKTADFFLDSENKSIDNQNLFTRVSDINAMLDFVQQSKSMQHTKIDIVASEKDENGFEFYDSVKLLCLSIFGDEIFFKNNIFFTYDISRLHKILQQNAG